MRNPPGGRCLLGFPGRFTGPAMCQAPSVPVRKADTGRTGEKPARTDARRHGVGPGPGAGRARSRGSAASVRSVACSGAAHRGDSESTSSPAGLPEASSVLQVPWVDGAVRSRPPVHPSPLALAASHGRPPFILYLARTKQNTRERNSTTEPAQFYLLPPSLCAWHAEYFIHHFVQPGKCKRGETTPSRI